MPCRCFSLSMLAAGEAEAAVRNIVSGVVFVLSTAHLLGVATLPYSRALILLWAGPAIFALLPKMGSTALAAAICAALM